MNDAELAAQLATEAGRILLDIRKRPDLDGKALGAAGDVEANAYLVDALLKARPEDGLLSEERKCDGSRLTQSRVWIIDPLDGTREYGEGRNDWAVHVALAVDGVAMVGAVALPGLGVTLSSGAPPPVAPPNKPPNLVVSRTRPAAEAVAVASALGGVLVPMGSAGAKAMAVVLGEADIYLHTGGQYEWDNCAPVWR
jgi:3'(2'), 5'-bisphosphate nucleotidase